MNEKVFNVKGMTCGHCKMAVKEAVTDLDGVSSCEVDLEKGTAKVVFSDDVTDKDIISAIEEEGFKVS